MTDKPETVADVLSDERKCAEEAGYSYTPADLKKAFDRIERAMAESAEHPHSSLRGTLVCDDCQSRDFNVYNEGAGVLFCRECGQYQKLKIAPPTVPVESLGMDADEVLVAIKRGEGYEDVHPQLVADDAFGETPFAYRVVDSAPPPASVPDGLLAATRRLAFAARTSGGTAGHDAELCAALDAIEAILATTPEESP